MIHEPKAHIMNSTQLPAISRMRPVVTRSISAENPTGAPGQGGRAVPGPEYPPGGLGVGWKVSPCVVIGAGETFEVANIEGTGRITHLWFTQGPAFARTTLLRMYWDGDPEPAVEVPLLDLFVQGTGVFAQVNAVPISANPTGGLNSYWPMPFRSGARVTVENLSAAPLVLFYQVTYEVGGDVEGEGYFHAQWRRSDPLEYKKPHVLLEGIEGQGQYVGTSMVWQSNTNGWWGEGEIKFYMDDDTDFPTICGTGTEDYFGGAYNFADRTTSDYVEFSTPYLGMPQVIRPDGIYAAQTRFALYRYHVADPIHFAERLPKVEILALGFRQGGAGTRFRALQDDIASTALFYLDRTSTHRPPAPDGDALEMYNGHSAAPGGPPMHVRFLMDG
jgi:hypothetical protein